MGPATWRAIFLIAGLAALSYVLSDQDWQAFSRLGDALTLALAAAILVHVGVVVIDAISWRMVLITPEPPGLVRMIQARLIGEAWNSVLPLASMGGEPIKVWLLHQRCGVGWANGIASIIAGRWVNMLASLPFTMIGLGCLAVLGDPGLLIWYVLLGCFAFLIIATLILFGVQWCARRLDDPGRLALALQNRLRGLAGRQLAGWSTRLPDGLHSLAACFTLLYGTERPRIWRASVISFGQWGLGACEIVVALVASGLIGVGGWSDPGHLFYWLGIAMALEAAVILARAASFMIPAGIGAQDILLLVLGEVLFGPGAAALMVVAVKRGREIFFVAIGVLAGPLIGAMGQVRR